MAKTSTGKKVLIVLSALLVVGLAGSTTYLFIENKDLKKTASLSEEDKLNIENDKIISEVSKLIDLPDEDPTIFKVNDPEKTEEGNPGITELFPDLQKDDYLLVYKVNRLGIQYRQSQNKIVKTATITLPISIEVFGTEEAVAEIEQKLLALYNNRVVIIKQNIDGITQSFVYDNTGKLKTETEALSKEMAIEVGSTLPTSITPSDQTEIVIVVTKTADASTQQP
jgi:hypothetical protein